MRVRRRQVVTLAALAAAAGAIGVVWNYTSVVPDQVSRRFTDNLLRERGYQLELDAVRTAVTGELLILHPRISTLEKTPRVVMRADAVRVRLGELRGLLDGRVSVVKLRVERPRFSLLPGLPPPILPDA